MGKKYIIELLDDCPSEFKGIIVFGLTPNGQISAEPIPVEDLTPYTEPDMEQVRKEAYEAGMNSNAVRMADDKAHESYQRGLNDAWEAARKIYLPEDHGGLGYEMRMKVFDTDNIGWLFKNLSASEAIEKIRAYDEKKKADQEIKVGNWVQNGGVIGVVTYIEQTDDGICYHVLGEDGHLWYLGDKVTKKYEGRAPKEIAGFLKKMKEG